MVKTQTKTKTVIAVGLTVISVGAMAAGLYYYGARNIVTAPVESKTSATPDTQVSTKETETPTTTWGSQTGTSSASASASGKYAAVGCSVGKTLNAICKGKGHEGATGIMTAGTKAPNAPQLITLLIPGDTSSASVIVPKNPCIIQCRGSESEDIETIGAVRGKSPDESCKSQGYAGSTGITSAAESHWITQFGGFESTCAWRPCAVQCYK